MNRLDAKFKELGEKRKKAFIAYITAGDPDLATTEALVLAFEKTGVDIIELGIPFSDPLADGPTIQAASIRSLQGGATIEKIFRTVASIRKQSQIPLVFMTYYNPIFHYGEDAFVKRSKEVGIDGFIVPDLPPHEAENFIRAAKKENLATIFFLSPTTARERMRGIIQVSTGFIYYLSLTGVTGARQELPADLPKDLAKIKQLTSKPLCVGVGISTPQQVHALTQICDGVIVGSAIVKEIEKNMGKTDLVKSVTDFVTGLLAGIK